jgi:hypothetical protein
MQLEIRGQKLWFSQNRGTKTTLKPKNYFAKGNGVKSNVTTTNNFFYCFS